MTNDDKIIAITCNCGGAKAAVDGKLHVIVQQKFKEKNGQAGSGNQPPLRPNFRHYRIREVKTKTELADIRELAERVGVWEYLQRPGAGADKVVMLPELNSWFDARQDYNVLKNIKEEEMEYVYSLGIKV